MDSRRGIVRNTQSTAKVRLRWAAVLPIVALGFGVGACSTSTKATAPQPTVQTPLPTLPARPQRGKPAPDAAVTAITVYETKHGPKLGTWLITSVQASKVDASFVMYDISPAAPNDVNVRPGYGFAHRVGTTWTVVAFGSVAVGCGPGVPGNAKIPPTVLSAFGLRCAG
jgi:hypothetical protein